MKKFLKKVKVFVKKKKLVKKLVLAVAVVKFLADFVDVLAFFGKLWEVIQQCFNLICPRFSNA